MPIRVKWDQYETALLIETFWNIEENLRFFAGRFLKFVETY